MGAGRDLRAVGEEQSDHLHAPGRLRLDASRPQQLRMAGRAAGGVHQRRPSIWGNQRAESTVFKFQCLKFKSDLGSGAHYRH